MGLCPNSTPASFLQDYYPSAPFLPWALGPILHLPRKNLGATILHLIKQTAPASQTGCELGILDPKPSEDFAGCAVWRLYALMPWIVHHHSCICTVTCIGITYRLLHSYSGSLWIHWKKEWINGVRKKACGMIPKWRFCWTYVLICNPV